MAALPWVIAGISLAGAAAVLLVAWVTEALHEFDAALEYVLDAED